MRLFFRFSSSPIICSIFCLLLPFPLFFLLSFGIASSLDPSRMSWKKYNKSRKDGTKIDWKDSMNENAKKGLKNKMKPIVSKKIKIISSQNNFKFYWMKNSIRRTKKIAQLMCKGMETKFRIFTYKLINVSHWIEFSTLCAHTEWMNEAKQQRIHQRRNDCVYSDINFNWYRKCEIRRNLQICSKCR